jgi:hypothetical protein
MKQKARIAVKKNVANFFGALGYLFGLLQWFWSVMLYFSVVQSTTKFISPDAGSGQIEQTSDFTLTLPDPLKWVVLVIAMAAAVAITVYALIKMPMDIVKNSNKAVHKSAEAVAPLLIRAQHKKDSKKSRLKITSRVVIVLKLLLVIIPLAFALASGLLEKQYVDYSIAMIVGYGLAFFSGGAFALQYLAARLFRVKIQDLW